MKINREETFPEDIFFNLFKIKKNKNNKFLNQQSKLSPFYINSAYFTYKLDYRGLINNSLKLATPNPVNV